MSNPSRRIFQAVHRTTRSTTQNKNPFPLSSSSSSSPIHSNNPQNPLLRSLIIRRTIYSSGFSNSISPEIRSTFHHHHRSFSNNNKLLLSSPNNTLLPPPPFNPLKLSSNFTTRSTSSSSSSQRQLQQLGFYRHFSFKTSGFTTSSKFNANFTKTLLVDKPISALRSAFVRYREAVGLQIEAFWRRNYLALLGVGAFGLCMLLWRIMFGIADTFIGFSEGMAKYGFLALSTAIVAFAGLYVRSRFTINPDKVYRIAMRRLNTSAEILEVMGAPLSGTDLRAYVMSAGGLRLKNFKPKLGGKRCFLIFPIRGSERKGLVSVEVKKRKGQYDMKLLAVDVPMTTGPDQRFFLIGDEEEYKVGGGLISELRDPIVKAMAAVKEFEALDQKEDEEDAERELEEAERKNREEIEKLEKGG